MKTCLSRTFREAIDQTTKAYDAIRLRESLEGRRLLNKGPPAYLVYYSTYYINYTLQQL